MAHSSLRPDPTRAAARAWRALWLFVLALLAPAIAHADGFIVIIPPEPLPRPMPIHERRARFFPLRVKHHDVTVTVKDRVAVTEVDQVFHNPNPQVLEGTYIFPVPKDAAVSGLSLWMGGKEVEGELLDQDKAREIYEGIVRKMKDPALLEYAGRQLFKARVYPIPANGDARVKVRYEQVLAGEGGLVEYRYPLSTEKFSSAPLDRAKVEVRLTGMKGNAFSPSHEVTVKRDGDDLVARYEQNNVTPDRDFVLYHRPEATGQIGLTLLSGKPADEDGTFLLLLAPKTLGEVDAPAKDVVFVVDRSGSMAGDKMQQAKAALRYCLRSLGPKDRFQIVDFGTSVRSFEEEALATADEVTKALAYVDAMKARGGTDLHGALAEALALPGEKDRPFLVVLMTDGEPTIGVTVPKTIRDQIKQRREARANKDDVRLFAFGIGSDLNAVLLDQLAEDNRGQRSYIGDKESIEVKISSFFDQVSAPVMTDVTIKVEGQRIYDVYPKPIPDLFFGTEVALLGRYTETGAKAIRLSGKIQGKPVELVYEARFASADRAPFLPRALAVRKVAYLLDEIRLHGEKQELKDEVVRLAKRFGIVTPFTSYLVVEDDEIASRPGQQSAAARAMRRLRRDARGFAEAEGEARDALDGSATGGRATSASEALKKLGEGSSPSPSSPPLLDAEPSEEVGGLIRERGRFAGEGDDEAKGRAEAQATKAEQVLRDVVRVVQGRAFYREGELWVDAHADGAKPESIEKIAYLSDAYFAFVAENPEVGEVLAIAIQVRVRVGDRVVEITP